MKGDSAVVVALFALMVLDASCAPRFRWSRGGMLVVSDVSDIQAGLDACAVGSGAPGWTLAVDVRVFPHGGASHQIAALKPFGYVQGSNPPDGALRACIATVFRPIRYPRHRRAPVDLEFSFMLLDHSLAADWKSVVEAALADGRAAEVEEWAHDYHGVAPYRSESYAVLGKVACVRGDAALLRTAVSAVSGQDRVAIRVFCGERWQQLSVGSAQRHE